MYSHVTPPPRLWQALQLLYSCQGIQFGWQCRNEPYRQLPQVSSPRPGAFFSCHLRTERDENKHVRLSRSLSSCTHRPPSSAAGRLSCPAAAQGDPSGPPHTPPASSQHSSPPNCEQYTLKTKLYTVGKPSLVPRPYSSSYGLGTRPVKNITNSN